MKGCVFGLLLLAISVGLAEAQRAAVPVESFKVEWQPLGQHMRPGVEGYVYNHSDYRVTNVRLKIEVLDGTNQVVRQQSDWVYGSIDPGARAYFVTKPPARGETYRITVDSFDLISRQPPGQAP